MARKWKPANIQSNVLRLGTGLVLAALTSQAFAAAFQLLEQNVTNLGLAYSGTAALAEDASTGFWNPAGLARIRDGQVVVSGVAIQGSFAFQASAVTPSVPVLAGVAAPLGGQAMTLGEDDPARLAGIPTLNIAKRLNDRWVFGFNINTPWGLRTVYDGNGIARYMATASELYTVNFSPSMSYQINNCWAIGGGVDFEYATARLDSQIGTGFSGEDGFLRNQADGWGFGFHLGVLWEPCPTTRVGAQYRSKVNIDAEGPAEGDTGLFNVVLGQPDIYHIQTVRSRVVLPETATVSLYQELGAFNPAWSCLAVTADVAWTNWSRFHTLKLRYNPGFGDGIDNDTWLHYKDTYRFSLGMQYTHSPCWIFNMGLSYDQSPTTDKYRTARIPDSDRFWVATGVAYVPTSCLRFDVGYAHIFFRKSTLDEHAPFAANTTEPVSSATLVGHYKPYGNLVGIQMRYDFV